MSDPNKKRGVRFYATVVAVVVAVALLYPLSIGPAIWLASRGYLRESTVQSLYMPVLLTAEQAEWLENAVTWWGSLGVPDGKSVDFMYETDEALHVFQFTRTGEGMPL